MKLPEKIESFCKSYCQNFYYAINMKIYICSCVRSFVSSSWLNLHYYLFGFQKSDSVKWYTYNWPKALFIRTLNQDDPEMGNVPKRIDVCLKKKKLLSKINTIKTQNKTQTIQWMFSKYGFWRVLSSGFVYILFQNVTAWKHDLTWYDLISRMGRRFIGIEPIRRKHFCKQHIFHDRLNAICIP